MIGAEEDEEEEEGRHRGEREAVSKVEGEVPQALEAGTSCGRLSLSSGCLVRMKVTMDLRKDGKGGRGRRRRRG